jgi:GLPGLI family protein
MRLQFLLLLFVLSSFNQMAFGQGSYEITYRMGRKSANPDSASIPKFQIKLLFNDSIAFSTLLSKGENLYTEFGKIGKRVTMNHTYISCIKRDSVFNLLRWPEVKKNCFVYDMPYYKKWVIDTVSSFSLYNYSCQQAYTVTASGDTAFAWFTRDLPGQFGPLFFSGLPGIVLATVEQPNGRSYFAEKVEKINYDLLLPQGTSIYTKSDYDDKIKNQ